MSIKRAEAHFYSVYKIFLMLIKSLELYFYSVYKIFLVFLHLCLFLLTLQNISGLLTFVFVLYKAFISRIMY